MAFLPVVLSGLSAVTAEVEQLLDAVVAKLRVPAIFGVMEEDGMRPFSTGLLLTRRPKRYMRPRIWRHTRTRAACGWAVARSSSRH